MSTLAYQIISISLSIISFGIILYVGLKTDVLRESVPNVHLKDRMYSLGRFQFWIWTLIICPVFILFWGFSTYHGIDLNTTAVVLLGIPAGVAVTSQVISSSQSSDLNETDHVRSEAVAENSKNATVTHTKAVSDAADPSTVKSTTDDPTTLRSPAPVVLKMHQKSKSFFIDLISDDTGQLSLGRLQQFIFTLVFIVIYASAFFGKEMNVLPDFGGEVFALMGISSGTYLVSKGMNK